MVLVKNKLIQHSSIIPVLGTVLLFLIPVISFLILHKRCDNYITPMETGVSAASFLLCLLLIFNSYKSRKAYNSKGFILSYIFPAFIAFRILSAVYSHNISNSVPALLLYLTAYFLYVFFNETCTSKDNRVSVITIIVTASTLFSLHGILQFSGYDFVSQQSRYAQSGFKALHVFSIFGNSNLLSSFLSISAGPALLLFMNSKKTIAKAFFLVSFLLICAAVFLSGARTGIFAVSISSAIILIFTMFKQKSLRLITAMFFVIVTFSAIFIVLHNPGSKEKETSFLLRSLYWKASVMMFVDKPMGSGVGSFKSRYIDYQARALGEMPAPELAIAVNTEKPGHPHNEFLFLLVESGPLALVLFSLTLFIPIAAMFRSPTFESLLYGTMATSFAIISFTGFPLMVPLSIALLPVIASFSNTHELELQNSTGVISQNTKMATSPSSLRSYPIVMGLLLVNIILFQSYSKLNSNIYLTTAKRALSTKDYFKAVSSIKEALRYMPSNDEALFTAGVLEMESGKYEDALGFFHDATVSSSDKSLLRNIARANMLLGNYSDAEKTLIRVEAAYPADIDIKMMLLDVFLKTQRFIVAEQITKSALSIDPTNEYLKIMNAKLIELNKAMVEEQ